MDTVQDRVRKGVAFLDEEAPGWFDEVDLSRSLDMSSIEHCILGQCGHRIEGRADGTPHYWRVLDLFGGSGITEREHWAHDHGFVALDDHYSELTAWWWDVVHARQSGHPDPFEVEA